MRITFATHTLAKNRRAQHAVDCRTALNARSDRAIASGGTALNHRMRCKTKMANCACERGPRRAATVSSIVARDEAKSLNSRLEAKKVYNRAQ
eukprot:6173447-Pleurochrysis_carterae.AAC.1